MPKSNVDEAFELVLVIAGLVAAIMTSFPELFWAPTEDLSLTVMAVQNTLIPMVVILTIWISGKLVMRAQLIALTNNYVIIQIASNYANILLP
jgi:hypothetical protein